MDDDFNSARSIGIIFDAVRSLNRLLDQHENSGIDQIKQTEQLELPFREQLEYENSGSDQIKKTIQCGLADIRRTGEILGMFLEHPTKYFDNKQTRVLEQKSIDPAVVAEMVEKREVARKAKNWEMADQIRKELVDMGISLEDRAEGPIWKINN